MCVHLFLKPILPSTLKPQKVYSSLLMVNLSIDLQRCTEKALGKLDVAHWRRDLILQ